MVVKRLISFENHLQAMKFVQNDYNSRNNGLTNALLNNQSKGRRLNYYF